MEPVDASDRVVVPAKKEAGLIADILLVPLGDEREGDHRRKRSILCSL